ncbi:hypothetical protein JMM62_17620 [Rhodovulum sulfidophilum]|nr:hypothetical protein [Rhodovulum sulfidophilum]
MRETDETSGSLFRHVDPEARIPAMHPLQKIRQVVNGTLARLDGDSKVLYVDFGSPSITPDRLSCAAFWKSSSRFGPNGS